MNNEASCWKMNNIAVLKLVVLGEQYILLYNYLCFVVYLCLKCVLLFICCVVYV
jgi:hypothetical protein